MGRQTLLLAFSSWSFFLCGTETVLVMEDDACRIDISVSPHIIQERNRFKYHETLKENIVQICFAFLNTIKLEKIDWSVYL